MVSDKKKQFLQYTDTSGKKLPRKEMFPRSVGVRTNPISK